MPDSNGPGSVPVPDPTELTRLDIRAATDQWRRDIDAMRELFIVQLAMQDRERIALRELLMSEIERTAQIGLEKFEAVNARFLANDMAAQQTADERRISLDAALAAAKEAVAEQQKANAQALEKSERAQAEQNRSVALLLQTSIASLEDKIADLRSSRDSGIGARVAVTETRAEKHASVAQVYGAIAAGVGILGLIVAIIAFIATHK